MEVPANLPSEVTQGLSNLSISLQRSAGGNLQSLILYGGAARGRYRPGSSDVNVMIVLGDASIASLDQISAALESAWESFRVDPFIVASDEFQPAAESFPTKFIEIRRYHVVLHGQDPFASLQISPARAMIRIEQELLNLRMRLRRRYLSVQSSPQLMYQVLKESVVPLAVALGAMLELGGKSSPSIITRAAVLENAAGTLGLDIEAMKDLGALRGGEAPKLEAKTLYSRLLDSIGRAAEQCQEHLREAT